MIPDFPYNIRIILARLKKNVVSWGRESNIRMQHFFISGQSYSYNYYEESLVSSNLNSKLFRFHCVKPTTLGVKNGMFEFLNGLGEE